MRNRDVGTTSVCLDGRQEPYVGRYGGSETYTTKKTGLTEGNEELLIKQNRKLNIEGRECRKKQEERGKKKKG